MPVPMALISRGVPAYTNDDFSGSFAATKANDATYGGQDYWRCAQTPVANANSGTLIAPVWLAYDLSGVSSTQRQNIVLVWYNDPSTDPYNSSLISVNYFNTPKDYTIETNTAAGGGAAPTSGWTVQATVSGNPYHSRQHAFNLSGANWVRINVSGINGSVSNNNCAINMDVFDAHNGNTDNWIFYGDSIASQGLDHDDVNIGPILPAQINALRPLSLPLMENGGVGGYTAADGAANIATWLPLFTGQYVGLLFGTNDANGGGALLTNFIANMTTMINAVIAAGKTPVTHKTIPYGLTTSILANGPTINANIQTLKNTFPSLILGPDLWAYFQANQTLISGDNIHPTLYAGYIAYRQQWANWATSTIYLNTLSTPARTAYKVRTALSTLAHTAYKVRTVLKTPARTAFKIQLSGVGPKPYRVVGVATNIAPLHPFSTISSNAVVVDQNNVPQNSLTATVTVTFPDASTATQQVYWLGSGQYSTTYTTKGAGTTTELWTFTDSAGSSAEYQNRISCQF